MKNNGGPAFPGEEYSGQIEYVEGIGNRHVMQSTPGMSLRDYFAAQALSTIAGYASEDLSTWDAEDMARHAYATADAMLAEREKQP